MSSGQNGGTVSVNFVLREDKIGDLSRLSLAPCTHNPGLERGESNHREGERERVVSIKVKSLYY